jgi:hypothetical protein
MRKMIINKSYDAFSVSHRRLSDCVSWGSRRLCRRPIGVRIGLRQPHRGNRV